MKDFRLNSQIKSTSNYINIYNIYISSKIIVNILYMARVFLSFCLLSSAPLYNTGSPHVKTPTFPHHFNPSMSQPLLPSPSGHSVHPHKWMDVESTLAAISLIHLEGERCGVLIADPLCPHPAYGLSSKW